MPFPLIWPKATTYAERIRSWTKEKLKSAIENESVDYKLEALKVEIQTREGK